MIGNSKYVSRKDIQIQEIQLNNRWVNMVATCVGTYILSASVENSRADLFHKVTMYLYVSSVMASLFILSKFFTKLSLHTTIWSFHY